MKTNFKINIGKLKEALGNMPNELDLYFGVDGKHISVGTLGHSTDEGFKQAENGTLDIFAAITLMEFVK